ATRYSSATTSVTSSACTRKATRSRWPAATRRIARRARRRRRHRRRGHRRRHRRRNRAKLAKARHHFRRQQLECPERFLVLRAAEVDLQRGLDLAGKSLAAATHLLHHIVRRADKSAALLDDL